MAEGNALQIVQWTSNYIGEQIPSTKILSFRGLRVYCPLWSCHIFILFATLRHMGWGDSTSFSNQVLTDQHYTT